MIQVEILRPIPTGERTFKPGEVMDATNWRNVEQLVSLGWCRYVMTTPEAEATGAPRRTARGGN